MKLYIKNMVCDRCKTTVKLELEKLAIGYTTIEFGEVNTKEELNPFQRKSLEEALLASGFELIDEKKHCLIEKLKRSILELELNTDEDLNTSYTDYIALQLKENFISLNTLFSEIEGVTIEKYILRRKIDRIKELLVYSDKNMEEIARGMHYSNSTQLSSQFKKFTGLTPYHFRQLRMSRSAIPT
ncbi:MAG: helix-turn-helix transcriptional regulator [Bacteroidetes bacterium]|nr:helix-turn-helix transcriptional regulator [Bacteroidota bacterium]